MTTSILAACSVQSFSRHYSLWKMMHRSKLIYKLALTFGLLCHITAAFFTPWVPRPRYCCLAATRKELSTDPFWKQLSHASELIALLSTSSDDSVVDRLIAQLSHSDGIRGFFVQYLTSDAFDAENIPQALCDALQQVSAKEELISLACMNVIMPTAMKTMHQDPTLQEASAKTAKRGIKILNYLQTLYPQPVKNTCNDIMQATREAQEEGTHNPYWRQFFANYGYGADQIRDIAQVMESFVYEY